MQIGHVSRATLPKPQPTSVCRFCNGRLIHSTSLGVEGRDGPDGSAKGSARSTQRVTSWGHYGAYKFQSWSMPSTTSCSKFFNDKFADANRLEACMWPPEYCCASSSSPTVVYAEDLPNITPKLDIFHLGVILWLLAESWSGDTDATSLRASLSLGDDPYTKAPSDQPFELSPLSRNIPEYYRNIVSACRSENPLDRPSARRLLQEFPIALDAEEEDVKDQATDVQSMKNRYPVRVFCDFCGNDCWNTFLHCNICRCGDFDICEKCFASGLHCLDAGHFLVKVTPSAVHSSPSWYASSPNASGEREIIQY